MRTVYALNKACPFMWAVWIFMHAFWSEHMLETSLSYYELMYVYIYRWSMSQKKVSWEHMQKVKSYQQSHSLIRNLAIYHHILQYQISLKEGSKDPDQTAQICKLIWVCIVCIYPEDTFYPVKIPIRLDVQADLNLHCVHIQSCRKCCALVSVTHLIRMEKTINLDIYHFMKPCNKTNITLKKTSL